MGLRDQRLDEPVKAKLMSHVNNPAISISKLAEYLLTYENICLSDYKKAGMDTNRSNNLDEIVWQKVQSDRNSGLLAYYLESGLTGHLDDARAMLAGIRQAELEANDGQAWQQILDCTDPVAKRKGLRNYIDTGYKLHRAEAEEALERMLREEKAAQDEAAWQQISGCFDREELKKRLLAYIDAGYENHQREACRLRDEIAEEEQNACDEAAWEEIRSAPDAAVSKPLLEAYIERHRNHLSEAKNWLEKLRQEEKLRRIGRDFQQCTSVADYQRFIQYYDGEAFATDWVGQAKEKIKNVILGDIKQHHIRISRRQIREAIQTYFKGDDSVLREIFRSENFINHIRTGAQPVLPDFVSVMNHKTHVQSPAGHTDVFFFGVTGSGKTCILSGLFALTGQLIPDCGVFKYDALKGEYANLLKDSTLNGTAAPATQTDYLELTYGDIEDESQHVHRLSLIEMPGEVVLDTMSIGKEKLSLQDIGIGATDLFCNRNQKIIFIVIDSDFNRQVQSKQNPDFSTSQSNAIDAIVSLFAQKENEELMKKYVDAIHIIVTKSDKIVPADDEKLEDAMMKKMMNTGFGGVVANLKKLCQTCNINANFGNNPCLFTFSLGKFLARDTGEDVDFFDFDPADSEKIMKVIRLFSLGEKPKSFYRDFCNYFN